MSIKKELKDRSALDKYKPEEEKIERLRVNLPTLRNTAGWSSDDLAELLDISRQSVSLLESEKGQLSRERYFAIRTLLDARAAEDESGVLAKLIYNLVDEPMDEAAEKELKADMDDTAKKVGRRVGSAVLGASLVGMLLANPGFTALSSNPGFTALSAAAAAIKIASKKDGEK